MCQTESKIWFKILVPWQKIFLFQLEMFAILTDLNIVMIIAVQNLWMLLHIVQ